MRVVLVQVGGVQAVDEREPSDRAQREATNLHAADPHRAIDAFLRRVDCAVGRAQSEHKPRMTSHHGGPRGCDQAPGDAARYVDVEPPGNRTFPSLEQLIDVPDIGKERAQALEQQRAIGSEVDRPRRAMQ